MAGRLMGDEPRSVFQRNVDELNVTTRRLELYCAHLDDVGFAESAVQLRRLRTVVNVLRLCDSAIETHLAAMWRREKLKQPVEVPDAGLVDVRRSAVRKQWNHENVARDIIGVLATSNHGVMPDGFTVRDAIMQAVGVSYWRTNVLKDMGLDPDDYCQRTPGTLKVTIT